MTQALQERVWRVPKTNARAKKVLLTDENPEELRYYAAILQRMRCDVRVCAAYSDAASLVAREDFDLVVVGPDAEGCEGRAVLARALEACPGIPVLVLNPSPRFRRFSEAPRGETLVLFNKPLPPSEVARLVNQCCPASMAVQPWPFAPPRSMAGNSATRAAASLA
jgi:DNA-binding NtrC family response regulator